MNYVNTSCLKRYLGLINLVQFDLINRLITLLVITLKLPTTVVEG
jgi:hypothetical protein